MKTPIGEALAGVEIEPLEEGDTAIAGVFVIRTLQADGEVGLSIRTSDAAEDLAIGMLLMGLDYKRMQARSGWIEDED